MAIVQSLWVGNELSLIERLCINSFLSHGDEFHLYTYGDVKNIPKGTIVHDANLIIPEKYIYRSHNGSLAHFADWFRWRLLSIRGGIWVDMDIVALRPFNFQEEIIFGLENIQKAAIGVLKFPKGHFLSKEMENISNYPNKLLPYDSPKTKIKKVYRYLLGNSKQSVEWGEASGPTGFTRALKYHELYKLAKPYTWFYFVSWDNWKCIFDDTFTDVSSFQRQSYGIHLWNEMIRREKKFDINKSYSERSLFSQLLKKYNVL